MASHLLPAKREFTTVTTQVEQEPAAWANLGLTHLRLGELDAAAVPVERALTLAPDNADLALLAGRMEIARGRLDEGVAHLRRAVELAPDALRPRFALAEEVERSGAADADTQALAEAADVIFAAGPAGKQLLSLEQLKRAKDLLVVTDVNAVPPAGVEGVGVNDSAKPIPGTKAVGIGALAVGNVKYKTEAGLFDQMIKSEKPIYLDFRDAYALAQKLAG